MSSRICALRRSLCILLFIGTTANAEPDKVELYSQSRLQQMQGQSALDIIQQIAGFQLVNSNKKRGLSNVAGNVLINGLPVFSKSQSLREVLAELPSNQLQSMQVYLADHPFTAVSQHTQVINLIRNPSQNKLNWRLGAKAQHSFHQPNSLSIQTSTDWHGWQHQLQLSAREDLFLSSTLYSESNATRQTYLRGIEKYREKLRDTNIELTSGKTLENSFLQLNTQYFQEDYREHYQRRWQQNTTKSAKFLEDSSKLNQFSLAFDWQQNAEQQPKTWLWQITGLIRREQLHKKSFSGQNSRPGTLTFDQQKTTDEQVLKLAGKQPGLWWQPEVGLEISRNQLNADTLEAELLNTQVRELRFEPYIASKLELTKQWQMYAKLTAEYANLKSQAKDLFRTQNRYLKPLLKLTHQANGGLQSTFSLQHLVKQLDFNDFIASQDSNFGRSQTGNSRLKPQQNLELSYGLNYDSGLGWNVNSKWFWQLQRDVHEYVKLDDTHWGIANAGNARLYGADIQLDIASSWLMQNSKINIQYKARHASYADPLTGDRLISGLVPHQADIEFRKNGLWYAWGMVLTLAQRETTFYPDEYYHQKDKMNTRFYTEFSLGQRLKLDIELLDIFKAKYSYERRVYTPDRSAALDYRYYAREQNDPTLLVSVSGDF